jgi:hypothetical protein
VPGAGRIESIADQLHAIDDETLLGSHVGGSVMPSPSANVRDSPSTVMLACVVVFMPSTRTSADTNRHRRRV